ncbi:MAG: hypothetical protein ABI360_10210 [Allobranchiibius sp.]
MPYLALAGSLIEARALGGVRSYLPDGRGVVWIAPLDDSITRAVDVEPARGPVSARLAKRVGTDDPAVVWSLWTRAEVAAKLLDLPVLSWLGWPGLVLPGPLAEQLSLTSFSLPDQPTGGILVTCGATIARQV